jgi:hypothetical protein
MWGLDDAGCGRRTISVPVRRTVPLRMRGVSRWFSAFWGKGPRCGDSNHSREVGLKLAAIRVSGHRRPHQPGLLLPLGGNTPSGCNLRAVDY